MKKMKDQTSMLTVGLLWHSITSDNLGVGALTLGQMALIEEAAHQRGADVSFYVIGTRGGMNYPINDFRVLDSAEFSFRALKAGRFNALKLLRRCDIVFDIGEGDSFADIYGNKRLFIQVAAKLLTRLFGKPLVLSPQTIGPFKTRTGRILGNIGTRLAHRVYARDHLSSDYLRQNGLAARAQEAIDVAFALPFERPLGELSRRTRIGINVSGLLYNGGYSGSNEFGLTVDYPDLIDRACELFLAMDDTDVFLVPHVITDTSAVEDDLRASQALAQRHPGLKVAPRFRSPVEAKSFISGLHFFTGARMHSCIAAFSSGVPVLPMAYSRKFNGLFNSIGYSHVLDCLQASTEEGLNMLANAVARRAELKHELDKGNLVARSKLEKYVNDVAEMLPISAKHAGAAV